MISRVVRCFVFGIPGTCSSQRTSALSRSREGVTGLVLATPQSKVGGGKDVLEMYVTRPARPSAPIGRPASASGRAGGGPSRGAKRPLLLPFVNAPFRPKLI